MQNIAQLKSLFKDDWEGIIGNCDSMVYLGGNEYGTFEYLSKILGKQTERTKSQSISRGSHGSSSESVQTAGRELSMPDEIRRLNDNDCLLLLRSEDPVIDQKYDLLKHPIYLYPVTELTIISQLIFFTDFSETTHSGQVFEPPPVK